MKIKYALIMLVVYMFLPFNVLASVTNFKTTLEMEPEITDNQIEIVIGSEGEEVTTISETLAYDNTKFTLVEVKNTDNYTLEVTNQEKDDKYDILTIEATSEAALSDTSYAIVVLKLNDTFKVNKTGNIFLYNVEANGLEESKYRNNGYVITIKRTSNNVAYYTTEDITKSTKIKYYVLDRLWLIGLIALLIIVIIMIILLLPGRKKESRERKIIEEVKKDNYSYSDEKLYNKEVLDALDKKETKDMSQAIIYDESVNPFGNTSSKYEHESKPEEKKEVKKEKPKLEKESKKLTHVMGEETIDTNKTQDFVPSSSLDSLNNLTDFNVLEEKNKRHKS